MNFAVFKRANTAGTSLGLVFHDIWPASLRGTGQSSPGFNKLLLYEG